MKGRPRCTIQEGGPLQSLNEEKICIKAFHPGTPISSRCVRCTGTGTEIIGAPINFAIGAPILVPTDFRGPVPIAWTDLLSVPVQVLCNFIFTPWECEVTL